MRAGHLWDAEAVHDARDVKGGTVKTDEQVDVFEQVEEFFELIVDENMDGTTMPGGDTGNLSACFGAVGFDVEKGCAVEEVGE